VYFLVPETKGKSLTEIEQLFELKQGSKRNSNKSKEGNQRISESETTRRTTEKSTTAASIDTKSTVTPTEQNKNAPSVQGKISVIAGTVD
jgi:plasmid replication initiation protein